ncbi:MAG: GspE/PulE family protein, partial [Pseudomonadales bacterium]
QALEEQRASGKKLSRALVDLGFVTEDETLQVLADQLDIPFIDLNQYRLDRAVVAMIPEIQARRFRAIALASDDKGVLVGMADPTDIFTYDDLCRILKRPVRLAVVREAELLQTLDTVYRKTEEINTFAEELDAQLDDSDIDIDEMAASAGVADAPVVKLLQSLFEDAIQIGSSDIHIEPEERSLRIRQRVDGVLHEQIMDESRIAPALVLRLKLIAGLNISEKRVPQDGRFTMRVKEKNIDVRISTMPTYHGEAVVMRLLDQSTGIIDMDRLGMEKSKLKRIKQLVGLPHGMFLVTGPTGSGKTTTLYAALATLNVPEKKIVTVEDPVEYRLPRLNQVQVNTAIDLTFARVLRTTLRQDPDIILIGEIRDEETADIALRAAMTGHQMLSTLHTNDAISTVNRLLDMGVKPYLLASALNAILSQRLVRKVCTSCARDIEPDAKERAWIDSFKAGDISDMNFKRGMGCNYCNYTGYAGRTGVYELLEFDQELTDLLGHGSSIEFERLSRQRLEGNTLSYLAMHTAAAGVTTIEEAQRVSADVAGLLDASFADA